MFNPFPTNPLVVVCGMGGGLIRPPIISQPLKGLEGWFFSMMCIYPRSIIRKRNFENRSKNKAKSGKNASEAFFGLISWNFFLQFWSHLWIYFCVRIKKLKWNVDLELPFCPLKWPFFSFVLARLTYKKGRRKTQIRPMTLIFGKRFVTLFC